MLKGGMKKILQGSQILRAVVSKYRLRCVKYEKSKSLKIFQNKGLWEVFKEK